MLGKNLGPQKAFPHLLILALVGHLVLAAGPYAGGAHASCSCAGTGSTEEALRRATAVFSGGVKEVGGLPQEDEGMVPPGSRHLLDVKGACKGVSRESVAVHGQGTGVSCGLDFERGET